MCAWIECLKLSSVWMCDDVEGLEWMCDDVDEICVKVEVD